MTLVASQKIDHKFIIHKANMFYINHTLTDDSFLIPSKSPTIYSLINMSLTTPG